MSASGVALVIVGTVLLAQVLAGDALQRLGVLA